VIEDVEDRIDGFAAEVWFSQPFSTWNGEFDKLTNRQSREIAMAVVGSPLRRSRELTRLCSCELTH
jgi:hypothetical protein